MLAMWLASGFPFGTHLSQESVKFSLYAAVVFPNCFGVLDAGSESFDELRIC